MYIPAYILSRWKWSGIRPRHGVEFADAVLALEDERALTVVDSGNYSEERFVALGMDPTGKLLVVVFTMRDERVRLISAREATRRERREYEVGQ